MNLWFSADAHFGHKNIIKYCNRPFKNVGQMNKVLIKRWNERVKQEDIVYFIGDFCFYKGKEALEGIYKPDYYIKQLNGNIIFIKGNHDSMNHLKTHIQNIVIKYGGQEIFLVHNPKDFNSFYTLNLIGHIHDNWKIKKIDGFNIYLINIGVDVWDYYPVNYNEIMKIVTKLAEELIERKIKYFEDILKKEN